MITLANTDLSISPLCLGGNVFGWTADAANSEAVLNHFVGTGGNFIDTADMYPNGHDGELAGVTEENQTIGRSSTFDREIHQWQRHACPFRDEMYHSTRNPDQS